MYDFASPPPHARVCSIVVETVENTPGRLMLVQIQCKQLSQILKATSTVHGARVTNKFIPSYRFKDTKTIHIHTDTFLPSVAHFAILFRTLFLVFQAHRRKFEPHRATISETMATGTAAAKYVLKVPRIDRMSSVMLNSPDTNVSGDENGCKPR